MVTQNGLKGSSCDQAHKTTKGLVVDGNTQYQLNFKLQESPYFTEKISKSMRL